MVSEVVTYLKDNYLDNIVLTILLDNIVILFLCNTRFISSATGLDRTVGNMFMKFRGMLKYLLLFKKIKCTNLARYNMLVLSRLSRICLIVSSIFLFGKISDTCSRNKGQNFINMCCILGIDFVFRRG